MTRKDADDFVVWAHGGDHSRGPARLCAFLPSRVSICLTRWRSFSSGRAACRSTAVFWAWVGAIILFCRKRNLELFAVADLIAPGGSYRVCFFGRIANFINAELFGRTTDVPWSVIFPNGGPLGRHPSQLYEAGLEGLLLFGIVCLIYFGTTARMRPGLLTGVFTAGYALARLFVELFREPDAHLGFLAGGITMGQVLSVPLLLFGLFLVWRAVQRAPLVPDLPVTTTALERHLRGVIATQGPAHHGALHGRGPWAHPEHGYYMTRDPIWCRRGFHHCA